MYPTRRVNDSVQWYMNEITSRVVAESGVATDIYHFGKILLRSLKDDPDHVLQIDGATGESETSGSVLERSVRCAMALKKLGLEKGDVITLMAPNHLHLAIPFYAALYLGVVVSAVDWTFSVTELQGVFGTTSPKAIFCQRARVADIRLALKKIDSAAFIVTFDEEDSTCSFQDFLKTYDGKSPVEDFKPADFDPDETTALLVNTSGTTGLPKFAVATHKNLVITGPYQWNRHTSFPTPTKMVMLVSPLQWLTAIVIFLMSPVLRFTRLQTSLTVTQQHAYDLINNYKVSVGGAYLVPEFTHALSLGYIHNVFAEKTTFDLVVTYHQPTYIIASPPFMIRLIRSEASSQCDFSCFETIILAGSAMTPDLEQELKTISRDAEVINAIGMTETTAMTFVNEGLIPSSATIGKPMGGWQYRLIDVETQEDIHEPNKNGELWITGPGLVKGYYKNPEATAEAFTEDNWFKTGDMYYRDEYYNFFFVERIKLLLKYMSHQISPVELEATIRQHPGVLDVAVAGIPDLECGDLPVAYVMRRPGADVTAEEINHLVKEELADSKQLRGGIIFVDSIPQTTTGKVHRKKIREMALGLQRAY